MSRLNMKAKDRMKLSVQPGGYCLNSFQVFRKPQSLVLCALFFLSYFIPSSNFKNFNILFLRIPLHHFENIHFCLFYIANPISSQNSHLQGLAISLHCTTSNSFRLSSSSCILNPHPLLFPIPDSKQWHYCRKKSHIQVKPALKGEGRRWMRPSPKGLRQETDAPQP